LQFRDHTLPNGLQIVAECNDKAYSTAIGYFVRAGARDETDELSGVSHFLEHMAFKGTAHRTAAEVNQQLDQIGSHSNASTSEEQTIYYAAMLPEYQQTAVEILSDMMRPSLRPEDFDTEKQVILEEIAKYDDQPPFGAHEKAMSQHFGNHPLGRSVLGSVESVKALTADQMGSYFEQRYSPGNMVLTAAGNVDFDALINTAKQMCGQWPSFPVTRETSRAEPHDGFLNLHKETATQQYLVQIANGPAADDHQRYAARLLATIFGDDSGSRLYWEMIETGLAEYAGLDCYEFQGTGIFMTYLCGAPEDAQQILQHATDMKHRLQEDGVSEEELAQAKSKTCSHVVLSSERPMHRLYAVGANWLQRGEYRTVSDVVDAYQAVTVADIREILDTFPLTEETTVTIGPLKQMDRPDKP
jgi:predicted Zn-dependent peptidase